MTFHSRSTKIEPKEKKTELGIKGWIKGKTQAANLLPQNPKSLKTTARCLVETV